LLFKHKSILKMKNKKTILLFIALINVFSFQLLAQKKFELTDMDKLYTLTEPQISPDGKSVLVVVSKPDTTTNKNKSFIYKVDVVSGATKQLTYERSLVSYPRWSPSGNAIAFIAADANAKAQLFLLSVNGGEAKKITNAPMGVTQFEWSPDGTVFAFVQQDEITNKKQIDKGYDGFEIKYNSMFLNARPNPSHLWLIATDSGEAKRLTVGNWTVPAAVANSFSWSPNGKNIVLQSNESPYSGELIFTIKNVEVATGKINRITTTQIPPDAMHKERQPAFSPDGKSIAYQRNLENVGYGFDVFLTSPNAGNGINLTAKIDRCFFRAEWSTVSKAIFVAANDFNTFTWKSDEFTPNGILTFPPDFDPTKKYPLVLEPHGGPRSTSKELFNSSAQLKAAHGYIVFQPNYRGSDNMGYRFSEAINGDNGEGPGRDVMRGLAELKKRSYIDTANIAVTGWSYGGFMTTWLIGNYQGWKCAVAGAAVTDWMAQYTQSDLGSMYRFEYGKGKSPFTNKKVKENWIKNSPITYAENVKTPTLILSDIGDERVPISESYTYFRALQDNGTESKFIAFPIAGHVPTDPIRNKEMNRYILEWLDKYLK
jgi:dipeptidyl aminopeptidase/acylaminoacyl peptidase